MLLCWISMTRESQRIPRDISPEWRGAASASVCVRRILAQWARTWPRVAWTSQRLSPHRYRICPQVLKRRNGLVVSVRKCRGPDLVSLRYVGVWSLGVTLPSRQFCFLHSRRAWCQFRLLPPCPFNFLLWFRPLAGIALARRPEGIPKAGTRP